MSTRHSSLDALLSSLDLDSSCTPAAVNILYLSKHPVTAVELITFFPRHTIWREVAWRLLNNGWTTTLIVKHIMWARALSDPNTIRATTIEIQFAQARRWAENTHPAGPVTKYDMVGVDSTRGLKGIDRVLEDYRLVDLANGVRHMPQGEDRGILTEAIQLAISTQSDVRLSGYEDFVDAHLALLAKNDWVNQSRKTGMNPDREAARRVRQTDAIHHHARTIGYVRR